MSCSLVCLCRLTIAARCMRNYHIYRHIPASRRHDQFDDHLYTKHTNVSAGIGYCVSFDSTTNSVTLFNRDSWFGKYIPLSSQKKGCTFEVGDGGECIKDVSCGRNHFLVLTSSRNVYSFGSNCFGQCGRKRTGQSDAPESFQMQWPIEPLSSSVCKISCGLDHSLILTDDGRVISCGWSGDGQTGVESTNHVSVPTFIRGPLNNHIVTDVCTMADSCYAITEQNRIFVWGNNEYGQLGLSPGENGNEPQIHTPVEISHNIFEHKVVSMATGGSFTGFLTEGGEIFYCGYGLGEEVNDNKWSVSSLSKLRHLYSIPRDEMNNVTLHTGLHYMALKANNDITIWGTVNGSYKMADKIHKTSSEGVIYIGTDGLYIVSTS